MKEPLKPTWKAGQINKEAHKTIVKKVVDKVTSSVQASHIPQTQEKIDNYLSAYKPKLSKLVQVCAVLLYSFKLLYSFHSNFEEDDMLQKVACLYLGIGEV